MESLAEKLYQGFYNMAYGKTVQDVFEKFITDNDRKIAEGADRNLKVEQLKQSKKANEDRAAMDRFNQAFNVMKAKEGQANRAQNIERQDAAIERQATQRAEDRQYQLDDVMHKENFQNMNREDTQRHQMELEGLKAENKAKSTAMKDKKKGKTISEKTISELADLKSSQETSFKDLTAMVDKFDSNGPVSGRLASMNPWNEDAQQMNSLIRNSRQLIGKYLEGGKLIGADEKKYENIMPKLGDTKETIKNKMGNLKALLDSKVNAQLDGLSAAGYDTEGVSKIFKPQQDQPVMTDEEIDGMSDEEAIKAAQAQGLM